MTAFKKAKSNNWIEADNDFGDFDCLKEEVFDLKRPQPKKRPRENNNTLKNGPRSNSVPSEPPELTPKTFVESSELWINKHQPDRLEDLAVNPKKVHSGGVSLKTDNYSIRETIVLFISSLLIFECLN